MPFSHNKLLDNHNLSQGSGYFLCTRSHAEHFKTGCLWILMILGRNQNHAYFINGEAVAQRRFCLPWSLSSNSLRILILILWTWTTMGTHHPYFQSFRFGLLAALPNPQSPLSQHGHSDTYWLVLDSFFLQFCLILLLCLYLNKHRFSEASGHGVQRLTFFMQLLVFLHYRKKKGSQRTLWHWWIRTQGVTASLRVRGRNLWGVCSFRGF